MSPRRNFIRLRNPGNDRSVRLVGGSDVYADRTVQSVNIANAWTFSLWFRPSSVAFGDSIQWLIEKSGNNDGEILLIVNAFSANNIVAQIRTSGGDLLKLFHWDNRMTVDTWLHWVLTWDGTSLLGYFDGIEETPDLKQIDDSGSQSNQSRRFTRMPGVDFAGGQDMNAGHIGIWDVALSAAAITEIFDGKHSIDVGMSKGNYTAQANLQHYYRPGFVDEGFNDEGTASPLFNIGDNAVGITIDDIEKEAPA